MSYIVASVVHLQFQCTLPKLFTISSLHSVPTAFLSGVSNMKKEKSERYIKNEFVHPEWKLAESIKLGDIFSADTLKEVPIFKGKVRLCSR